MRRTLTQYKPGCTYWLDFSKMPYRKGRFGTLRFDVEWYFYSLLYILHVTDWRYPRRLTTVLEELNYREEATD